MKKIIGELMRDEKDGVKVNIDEDGLEIKINDQGEKAEVKIDENGLRIK